MTADLSSEESFRVALNGAILLYGHSHGVQYGTLHDIISEGGGQPRLGPGQSLTKRFIDEMLKGMASELEPEVLPECVLSRTRSAITWWVPAQSRSMFFSEHSERPHLNGKLFPHPALVFRATEGALSVWALTESRRPAAGTALHFAPYWNVSSNGCVCLGDAQRPSTLTVDTLPVWEEGFFGSYFSHPNTNRLTTHPQGFDGLWAGINGQKTFPVEMLLPSEITLSEVVRCPRQ